MQKPSVVKKEPVKAAPQTKAKDSSSDETSSEASDSSDDEVNHLRYCYSMHTVLDLGGNFLPRTL